MVGTPNLDALKAEIARLLAAGIPAPLVEEVVIGSSAEGARLYERAVYEYACLSQTVKEGRNSFTNGALSPGGRRSTAGFRLFITDGALS